jgi:hypothetical protein
MYLERNRPAITQSILPNRQVERPLAEKVLVDNSIKVKQIAQAAGRNRHLGNLDAGADVGGEHDPGHLGSAGAGAQLALFAFAASGT